MRAVRESLPTLVVSCLHDFAAEAPNGVEFRRRGRIHDQNFARYTRFAGSESHSLSGIARAYGPNTSLALLFGQKANSIVGAADLKCADWLQAFELQIYLGRSVVVQSN